MKLNDLLFGKPLRSSEEAGEKLGPIGASPSLAWTLSAPLRTGRRRH